MEIVMRLCLTPQDAARLASVPVTADVDARVQAMLAEADLQWWDSEMRHSASALA